MTDRYDELYRGFRWQVPARFNIAQACCGRHARQRERFALYFEDENGDAGAYTFWDVQMRANRLSNALAALGVGRGDRVALILPQRIGRDSEIPNAKSKMVKRLLHTRYRVADLDRRGDSHEHVPRSSRRLRDGAGANRGNPAAKTRRTQRSARKFFGERT